MKLPSPLLTSLGLLFTLATAADQCAGNKSAAGYCQILSSTDVTNNNHNAPTTSQCQSACRDVLTDAGDWSVSFKGQPAGYVQRMVGSACSFSVGRGGGEPTDYQFYMTNQDIVNIIGAVDSQFGAAHQGRVSAQGTMRCQGHLATWYVD